MVVVKIDDKIDYIEKRLVHNLGSLYRARRI